MPALASRSVETAADVRSVATAALPERIALTAVTAGPSARTRTVALSTSASASR